MYDKHIFNYANNVNVMEGIPNRKENSERLCKILKCTLEELPEKVPMEEE